MSFSTERNIPLPVLPVSRQVGRHSSGMRQDENSIPVSCSFLVSDNGRDAIDAKEAVSGMVTASSQLK